MASAEKNYVSKAEPILDNLLGLRSENDSPNGAAEAFLQPEEKNLVLELAAIKAANAPENDFSAVVDVLNEVSDRREETNANPLLKEKALLSAVILEDKEAVITEVLSTPGLAKEDKDILDGIMDGSMMSDSELRAQNIDDARKRLKTAYNEAKTLLSSEGGDVEEVKNLMSEIVLVRNLVRLLEARKELKPATKPKVNKVARREELKKVIEAEAPVLKEKEKDNSPTISDAVRYGKPPQGFFASVGEWWESLFKTGK